MGFDVCNFRGKSFFLDGNSDICCRQVACIRDGNLISNTLLSVWSIMYSCVHNKRILPNPIRLPRFTHISHSICHYFGFYSYALRKFFWGVIFILTAYFQPLPHPNPPPIITF